MAQSVHFRNWRALPKLRADARVRLLNQTINPWTPGIRGWQFWNDVLHVLLPDRDRVCTVHELEVLKDQLAIHDEGYGHKGHIGWLYTWENAPGFPFIEIDGQVFGRGANPWVPRVATPGEDRWQALMTERLDAIVQAVADLRRDINAAAAGDQP
jgi:hypothetical protein